MPSAWHSSRAGGQVRLTPKTEVHAAHDLCHLRTHDTGRHAPKPCGSDICTLCAPNVPGSHAAAAVPVHGGVVREPS